MTEQSTQTKPTTAQRLAAFSDWVARALGFVGLWLWYGMAMMVGVGLVSQSAGVSMYGFDPAYYTGMSIVALGFALVHRYLLFPQRGEPTAEAQEAGDVQD